MKSLLLYALTASVAAAELTDPQKKVVAIAETNQVELRLDLPYAENNNPKQCVDLYLPRKRNSEKPLPVIALIHGGGWVNGDRIGYAAQAIQLTRTGDFACVAVGYRLTKEASWPAQVHDCKAAIRWIRAHAKEHNLDPDRIAAWGSSAGGHLSSLLGTSGDVREIEGDLGAYDQHSSRIQAVVNLCGPEDFRQALMFTTDGKPIFKDDAVTGLLGGSAEDKPQNAAAASPATYASSDDAPFITFHGTQDQRVAFLHAETIHAALKKAGVESHLIPITGGGHGSVKHPDVKARGEIFLRRIFLGSKEPIPAEAIPAPAEAAK